MWLRWHKQIELMLLMMALLILGTAYFSRLTPEERRLKHKHITSDAPKELEPPD